MMTRILLSCAALALAACGGGTSSQRASPELAAQLPIKTEVGQRTFLDDRGIYIEDVSVSLSNRTSKTIYVPSVNTNVLSKYILDRNPRGIYYETNGGPGSIHLSSRGLMGGGPLLPLAPGENLTFIAPIPIFPSDSTDGTLRVVLMVYLDAKQRQARLLYSELVAHNQKR